MAFWNRRQPEERSHLAALDLRPFVPLTTAIPPAVALANADVYACTRVLCDAAASAPLIVYRRLADGNRRRAANRTADLLRAPAEGSTQANLVSTMLAHLLLHGNAFVGKYKDAEGRVEQLLPLAPDRVQVERRHGRVVFSITDERGRQSEHGLEDLIHVKGLSTDGLVGLSPIAQMRAALETSNAVRGAATALFANGARPSGILKLSGQVSHEQLEELRMTWTARHSDSRAGGIAVLSGGIDFLPIGMPADDAEFVAARKLSATEIARAFRIPPWMIGAEDGGSLTYSNVEQQALAFVSYGLRPWLVCIEQALTADQDLFTANFYAEFLLDALLRADSATRAGVYTQALDPITGWLRRDEVRKLENLPPETADDFPASMNGHSMMIGEAIAS